MKRTLAAIALTLGIGGTAFAGLKLPSPVTINPTNRTASGSLGSARNSSDNTQYLEVVVYQAKGKDTIAYVYGRDVNYNFVNCYTTDPAMIATLQHATSDSDLWVSWDETSVCVGAELINGSPYEPKAP